MLRFCCQCDGRPIPLPSLQGIAVLNIPSYAGGTNFWGGTKEDDVRIRVLGGLGLSPRVGWPEEGPLQEPWRSCGSGALYWEAEGRVEPAPVLAVMRGGEPPPPPKEAEQDRCGYRCGHGIWAQP